MTGVGNIKRNNNYCMVYRKVRCQVYKNTCGNCHFWCPHHITNEKYSTTGRCHYLPPTITVAWKDKSKAYEEYAVAVTDGVNHSRPMTEFGDTGCSRHRAGNEEWITFKVGYNTWLKRIQY